MLADQHCGDFVQMFSLFQREAHKTAKDKGWWENPAEDGTLLALMHSELSECLEALRAGNPRSTKIPSWTAAEAELADVIIRIMDYAEYHDYNIGGAILAKMEFNEGREHKHGGKKF